MQRSSWKRAWKFVYLLSSFVDIAKFTTVCLNNELYHLGSGKNGFLCVLFLNFSEIVHFKCFAPKTKYFRHGIETEDFRRDHNISSTKNKQNR